jgi:hypothetical protein
VSTAVTVNPTSFCSRGRGMLTADGLGARIIGWELDDSSWRHHGLTAEQLSCRRAPLGIFVSAGAVPTVASV